MRYVDFEQWQHKKYDIFLYGEHPKLYGKYEIYKDECFIERAATLKEAKEIIDERCNRDIPSYLKVKNKQ